MKCLLVALSLCLGGTAGLQCLPSEQAVIQAATKKGRVEQIIAQDDKGNELSAQTEQQQEKDPLVFQQCKDRQRDFKRNSKGS